MARKLPKKQPENYEVGKGRPPAATRWKPGQSGNPNGRPKKGTSLDDVVDAVLKQKVPIRERGAVRYMLPGEIMMVRQIIANAMKGDLKSFMALLKLGPAMRSPEPLRAMDTKGMTADELAKLYSEMIKKPY